MKNSVQFSDAVSQVADQPKPKHFKHVATLLEILIVPASSAPVERIFSTGREATTGKRNRLTNWNLEREVFLRQNKTTCSFVCSFDVSDVPALI